MKLSERIKETYPDNWIVKEIQELEAENQRLKEFSSFAQWHTTDTSHLHNPRIKAFEVVAEGGVYAVQLKAGFPQKHVAEKDCQTLNDLMDALANPAN